MKEPPPSEPIVARRRLGDPVPLSWIVADVIDC